MAREPFEGCSLDDPVIIPVWAPLCDDLTLEEPDYLNNTPTVEIPDIAFNGLCACYPEVDSTVDLDAEVSITYTDGGADPVFKLLRVDENGVRSDEPGHDFDCCFPDVALVFDLNLDCIPFNVNSNVNVVGGGGGSNLTLSSVGCDLNLTGTLNLAVPGGGITGAENVGGCTELFKQELANVLQFKTLNFPAPFAVDDSGDCIQVTFDLCAALADLGFSGSLSMTAGFTAVALNGVDECARLTVCELLTLGIEDLVPSTSQGNRLILRQPDGVCLWATLCEVLESTIDDYIGSTFQLIAHDKNGVCGWASVCEVLTLPPVQGGIADYDLAEVQLIQHDTAGVCSWVSACEMLTQGISSGYDEMAQQILIHEDGGACAWADVCSLLRDPIDGYDAGQNQVFGHDTSEDCTWTNICDIFPDHASSEGAGDILFRPTADSCEWVSLCYALLAGISGYNASVQQVLTHDDSGVCEWIAVTECP